jgi:hypothetical protein
MQIGSAVGGTTSAFYGFNHGIVFCLFLVDGRIIFLMFSNFSELVDFFLPAFCAY